MPLDASSCANDIKNALMDACKMQEDVDGNLVPKQNPDGSTIHPPTSNTFNIDFADAYHSYSLEGLIPGAEHGDEDSTIISSLLGGIDDSVSSSAFAQALANYWGDVLVVPGVPAHGGTSVIDVSNNASGLASAFENAIAGTISTEDAKPYFEPFILAVESVVETIEWTVVEMMPNGSPSSFIETIA